MKNIVLIAVIASLMGQSLFAKEIEDKSFHKKALFPITEDFSKAKEMAQAYRKPLAVLFTGSDWCQYSRRLLEETIFTKEFSEEVKKSFFFVHVDFPELNLHPSKKLIEQNYLLKEEFQVKDFPLIILIDEDLHEITRMGFSAETSSQYGKHLVSLLKKYTEIKNSLDVKNAIGFSDLREKYLEARDLGSPYLIDKILNLGLKQDKDCFFHLEKYSCSVGEEKKTLRKKILAMDKEHKTSIALRLAILDYQELQKTHSEDALSPLLDYAKNAGMDATQENWRVHMLISQHLCAEGQLEEALEHARLSLKIAPEGYHGEIKKSIKLLSAEMIAHRQ